MSHFYVSIPAACHKIFKYAGYVHPLNEDAHRKTFEKIGINGSADEVRHGCQVLSFDEYLGDRITGDGEPYGKQPYTPKQIILTKREGDKILRLMWSCKSSPGDEEHGRIYAKNEGCMMHCRPVNDETAWDRVIQMHREIEQHKGTMKDQVAAWLESLDTITDVEPASLTIGAETWEGAVYTQNGTRRYYMVGPLPASFTHDRRVCYLFDGDDRVWYIAGFMDDFTRLKDFQKECHPFGVHWILKAWEAPERIDAGRKPYRRLEIS